MHTISLLQPIGFQSHKLQIYITDIRYHRYQIYITDIRYHRYQIYITFLISGGCAQALYTSTLMQTRAWPMFHLYFPCLLSANSLLVRCTAMHGASTQHVYSIVIVHCTLKEHTIHLSYLSYALPKHYCARFKNALYLLPDPPYASFLVSNE